MSRWRALRTVLLSLALTSLGIGIVVREQDSRALLAAVVSVDAWALGSGLALLTLSHLAGGARLRLLAAIVGASVPFRRAVRAYLLGVFSAAVTPGGGGHPLAIGWALRRDGLTPQTAWSIALYPSVLDLLFYAWAVPASLFVLAGAGFADAVALRLTALATGVGLLLVWFLLAHRFSWLERGLHALFRLRALRRWHRRVMRFIVPFGIAVKSLSAMHPLTLLRLQLLTIVTHTAAYVILLVVAAGLGAHMEPLLGLAVLVVFSALGNVVPTPGASGYTELSVSLALTRGDAQATLVASAVLIWRAYVHYLGLAFGPVLAGSLWSQLANDARRGRLPR